MDHLTKFYTVAAVRALVNFKSGDQIWKTRQVLEETLSNDSHVVAFFSCGTSIETKKNNESTHIPGVTFWIVLDWPECGLKAYETYFSKLMVSSKLDLISCKGVRGRRKFKFLLLFFYFRDVERN